MDRPTESEPGKTDQTSTPPAGEEAAAPEAPAPDAAEVELSPTSEEPTPTSEAEGQDQEDEEDLLRNFGGGRPAVVDLFAPQLPDRSRLPADPAERLRAYEDAIESSQATLAATVTRARFRAEIEIGFLLDAIRSEPDLYVPKYGTIENYGEQRWGYKRSTLYELMDTAPVRVAAAALKAVSGNPDTKRRKAIEPPAPRSAPDADTPPPPPAAPVRPVELPKSAALELVPTWRDEGEEAALALLAKADHAAQESGKKLTAALIRKTRLDRSGQEEPGEKPGKIAPSEEEQRKAVNKALSNAAASAEKLIATLDQLGPVPPLDREAAEKDVKAIRAAGRWLDRNVKVPAEVIEGEVVE
ncbi:hypothetical protein ACFY73_29960 [Streptomyces albidoflavus]|uniref:hypothetical protein n=1 Tax=Streptomyces albidoflavus TaxID=1886 RepID=UPI0011C4C403|nr:hypothetical protein [Streptomyces albidoflavus]